MAKVKKSSDLNQRAKKSIVDFITGDDKGKEKKPESKPSKLTGSKAKAERLAAEKEAKNKN